MIFHHFVKELLYTFLDEVHLRSVTDGRGNCIHGGILLEHRTVVVIREEGDLDQDTGQAVLTENGVVIVVDRMTVGLKLRNVTYDVIVHAAGEKVVVVVMSSVVLVADREVRTLELGVLTHLTALTLDDGIIGDIVDLVTVLRAALTGIQMDRQEKHFVEFVFHLEKVL